MGAHRFPFREAEVTASAEAEAAPSADYLAAADLLPAFARRHADASDVASLARLLLASVMASGLTGSLAAGAAVKRASERLAEANRGSREAEVPAGDTYAEDFPEADHLARATYPAPDRLARVTEADRLAMVTDATFGPRPWTEDTAQAAEVLSLLATCPEAWGSGHGADPGKPSGVGIGSAMVGAPIARGRRSQAWANLAADLLASLDGGSLPAWVLLPARNGAEAAKHERGTLRDSRQATSGPASRVVRTFRNGSRWVTLEDRSVRVTEAEALAYLAWCDRLPAHHGGTAREVTTADLSSPRDLLPARRPAGVGVGMVHGSGQRAGAGAPEPRPTMSRRRKRDGGIGSPMVPA